MSRFKDPNDAWEQGYRDGWQSFKKIIDTQLPGEARWSAGGYHRSM